MFTPAPMAPALVVVLDEDLPRATAVLGRRGHMQLRPVAELGPWAKDLGWQDAESLAALYAGYRQRTLQLLQRLELSQQRPLVPEVHIAPRELSKPIADGLTQIERIVGRNAMRQAALQEELRRLASVARQLEALSPLPVDLERLRSLGYLHYAAALVPMRNLDRLRGSLAGQPAVILSVAREEDYQLILAFTTKGRETLLQQALRSASARVTEIPAEFTGTPREALDQLHARRDAIREESAKVTAGLRQAAAQYGDELRRLEQEATLNDAAVQAWRNLGTTQRTRVVFGWLPAAEIRDLSDRLRQALGDRVIVHEEPPVKPSSAAGPLPPTYVRQPPAFRPLETLVTTYGIPSYRELDPTLLAGSLFIVFFGFMFGDVGQGAILVAVGWLLAREYFMKGNSNYGWLMLAAGVSAVVFGALYGTVFLSESLLPALWVRPLDRSQYFLEVAIAFGVGVILVALVLNLINAYRMRDREELFLGRYGLVGLWFYGGTLLAGYSYLIGRRVSNAGFFLLIAAPLIVLFLHEPIWRLASGEGLRAALPGGQTIIQSAIETFDAAIRYIANTVSFIRLAAFAIAHVAFGIVVFTLADLVASGIGGAVVIVVGNGFVLALEGLVVFIQALRLDYYEFFTKFFRDEGFPFRPFVLPGSPARGAD